MKTCRLLTVVALGVFLAAVGCGGGGGGNGGTGGQSGTGAQGGTGTGAQAGSGTGAQGTGAQAGTGGATGGGGTGGSANLQWYTTCGDPACSGASDDPAIPECTGEMEGQPCSTAGMVCELTGDECNVNLVCSDMDPKQQPGGCPISLASAKHDIVYLTDEDRERIRREVVAMPLATWKYNHEDGERERLGFIIDDQPLSSAAVRPSGERVDLYGYTSMAVAAVQAQNREIEALRREVESLRQEIDRSRAAASTCSGPAAFAADP